MSGGETFAREICTREEFTLYIAYKIKNATSPRVRITHKVCSRKGLHEIVSVVSIVSIVS